MSRLPHTFCHYCGVKHTSESWPRTCGACGNTTWRNPTPVVVSLVRVRFNEADPNGDGLLVVRRAIEPEIGELAFPGGYVDYGETIQEAAARELAEETNGLVDLDPRYFVVHDIEKASSNENLLVFCLSRKVVRSVEYADLEQFKPNPEVSELRLIHSPVELAWPTHTDLAKRYFEGVIRWPE